ncbi:unnamed protein product [Leptosia nina]|uniref:Uncharacterized protein n=1 Tax=Leptosia nina TaxID=320188 RepID=A0AAV1JWM0_9NEOP
MRSYGRALRIQSAGSGSTHTSSRGNVRRWSGGLVWCAAMSRRCAKLEASTRANVLVADEFNEALLTEVPGDGRVSHERGASMMRRSVLFW